MKSKHLRSRIARVESLAHDPSPQSAGRPELCDLFQKLIVRVEEESYARRELIYVEPTIDRRLHIGDCVGERERNLLGRSRARFTNVIAGNRNRVPSRDFAGAVGEDVSHDSQARARRVDVSSARDVLLQNVVLNRARDLVGRNPLLLRRSDVHRQ